MYGAHVRLHVSTQSKRRITAYELTGDALTSVYGAHMRLHDSTRSECGITADELTSNALAGVYRAHVRLHCSTRSESRIAADKLAGNALAGVYGAHVALHVCNISERSRRRVYRTYARRCARSYVLFSFVLEITRPYRNSIRFGWSLLPVLK